MIRAIKDYRLAQQRLRQDPKDPIAKETVQECEQFFCSEWCYFLSGMDGDYILEKLRDTS